jgi:RNA exonuclease 4
MAAIKHLNLKRKRIEGVDVGDVCTPKKVKVDNDNHQQDVKETGVFLKKVKVKKGSKEHQAVDDINKIHTTDKKDGSVDSAKKCHKAKEKLQLPQSANEISANWKQLLQSGKVVCTQKKFLPTPPQPASDNKSKKTPKTLKGNNEDKSDKPSEIWFDDVDEILLEPQKVDNKKDPLVKPYSYQGVTKIIGIDCEMVGVGEGGQESILARVSLVNQYGQCIYDKFVKPTERVIDYRTHVSGIRPSDIAHGEDFKTVQKEVSDLLLGRILVGHAIHNDLKVLFLTHPRKNIRDTSKFKPFRQLFRGGTPSLKKLTEKLLAVKVQQGEHNSIQDAQAAMRLYTMYRKQWEKSLTQRPKSARQQKTSQSDSVTSDV